MNYRKIVSAFLSSSAIIVLVILLWKQTFVLALALIILALIKHYFSPIKHEFIWFVTIAIWGTSAEILIMNLGKEPWVYAEPIFLNIALWTPLLWGLAATTFITLHEGLFKSK